jgi:short-subunit dehydrogenase
LLRGVELRYTYRFVFVPGTIGSITWLALNEERAERIVHGLVAACVGDAGRLTYKRSRRGDADIDRAVAHVLAHSGEDYEIRDFTPYGYDERQYCSPGFNLPVGSLTRTPHGEYPEYHTSGDTPDLVRADRLFDSLRRYLEVFEVLEGNLTYENLSPKGEPQLGKRGLYGSVGGRSHAVANQMALLWVLSLCDGSRPLLDVAERSKLPFPEVQRAASALEAAGLLRVLDGTGGSPVSASLTGMALVTGSSGGTGRAVAKALAHRGMSLCLTGRDAGRLQGSAEAIRAPAGRVVVRQADLSTDGGIRGLVEHVSTDFGRIDVLVHAAGTLCLGNVEAAGWNDLDEQYRVNLRAPFLLTKALLPMLKESRGQVVFVNSTAGLAAGADNGLYAATKSALRSLSGSIRDHVNPFGIRVMSVYPGRMATPMQEAVHRFEGHRYEPEILLQPSDVADAIVAALELPRTAEVTDIMLRPMKKPVLRED